MLLFFPFIFFASFLGKVKGGNIIYSICKIWAHIWMFLIGIIHYNIYDSPYDPSIQYIFISNHISYMDIAIMMKAMHNQDFRILGKNDMAKIPLFGFIYRNAVVMVDRKSTKDRAESIRVLMSVIRKNISVFIFPEGTFNETKSPLKNFYDGAFRVAIETQKPIKPIVFLDSYSRLNYKSIFTFSPGLSRAVFLKETLTTGLTINDVYALKENIYKQMEACLIHYNAAWIKKTEHTK